MNKAILTVVMTGVVAVSLATPGAAFAGGNGNGGSGNAHGAATAGMTYQGDPISSAWTTKPAGWMMDQGSNMNTPSSSDTSNNSTTHAKPDPQ